MVNHQNNSHGRDTGGNPDHDTAGSSRSFTHVSSRLHGAAQDVSKLLDLITAGVAADRNSAASTGAKSGDDDAGEPGSPPQGSGHQGDCGDSR